VTGGTLRRRLAHAEHAAAAEWAHLAALVPAWARPTAGEARWPVVAAVLTVITLRMLLPPRLAFPPHWLLPAAQLVLLAGVTAVIRVGSATPGPCVPPRWR